MLITQLNEQFHRTLVPENPEFDPEKILNSIDIVKLIENHTCDPDEKNYERIVLFKDETYEVVFCHWKADGRSPIHDHDNKYCWFRCLEGTLTEERQSLENGLQEIPSSKSIISLLDSTEPHQIINKSDRCAFSLHLYKQSH